MIRKRVLKEPARQALLALARDTSVAHGVARRANAIILLDRGMSCEAIAQVLLIDDDTVRRWHRVYGEGGLAWLVQSNHEGSDCRLREA